MNGKNKSKVLIVILIVIILMLAGYVIYDKILYKYFEKAENINSNVEELKDTNTKLTQKDATIIAQKLYGDVYNILDEGYGIKSDTNVKLKLNNGTTIEANKCDFSKIEPYFTDRSMDYIKMYFTDTPHSYKDGNYYIFSNSDEWEHDKEFMNTIFGVTDQYLRSVKVIFYNENMIVGVSEDTAYFGGDEYIIFKKVNKVWKIDMFEEF